MRTNQRRVTHEGGRASDLTPDQELERTVMSCLLWEENFYESGEEIGARIARLVGKVGGEAAFRIAERARHEMYLRHVPLLICAGMAKHHPKYVAQAVHRCVHRVDELSEAVSVYWKLNPTTRNNKGGRRLSHQFEAGLRRAFLKFDEFQFAKYAFDKGKAVKLRDVMRLVRPDLGRGKENLFYKINQNKLEDPDTWENTALGGRLDREDWERLIAENKLGYMALLRNLRNMMKAKVDKKGLIAAIKAGRGSRYVLPFRYVAAARAVPDLADALDYALCKKIEELPKLKGRTIVLVDVSSSMDEKLSSKSDLSRLDAACAVAALVNAGQRRVFSFSNHLSEISRPALGLRCIEQIRLSQPHGGTYLGAAIRSLPECERLIVLTDEQTADQVGRPKAERAYMINVAAHQNGVGYGEDWIHIDGFSEGVLRYIAAVEEPKRLHAMDRQAGIREPGDTGWRTPLD